MHGAFMSTRSSRHSRRQTGPVAPSLLQACVIAVGTLVSAEILASGLGARLADQQPGPVVALGYASAPALAKLSQDQRQYRPESAADPDSPDEKTAARTQADLAWATGLKALAAQPWSATSLEALGQAATQRGDLEAARRLMLTATSLSHRASLASIWLANDALRQKDYGRALAQIDDLLRADPGAGETAYAALDQLAVLPEAADALVRLLADNPPWRAYFLEQLPGRVQDPLALEPLYTRLLSARPPLPETELKSFLDVLIQHGAVEQAYYIWLRTLPEERLTNLGYLYDGDFRYRPSNLPFDWELDPIEGASSTIGAVPGANGQRGLTVEFAESRVPYRNAAKLMVLPPGRYSLTGRVRAVDLASPRGMTWRVTCLDQAATQLGETPRVMGTTDGWQPFELTFRVPESGCEAQWLRLELAYRTSGEQEVMGSVSYTDFKLSKIELPDVTLPASAQARPPTPERQPAAH